MPLVPSRQPDDLEDLRSRTIELEALLKERAATLNRVKSELAAFKIRYQQQVGWLHEELDELEIAIAEAELGEISKRVTGDGGGPGNPIDRARPEPQPRYTSDAVRKLFRDVAKAIHPDLATDELTREQRHALMVEANLAYALGDEERLRWILQSWERSPATVQGDDSDATRTRILRRIAQMEEHLAVFMRDLDALHDSPMWQLKAMVDDAASRGKDLIREMVERLKVDILVARNRLDAIQSTP